jgi:hypothetical protein
LSITGNTITIYACDTGIDGDRITSDDQVKVTLSKVIASSAVVHALLLPVAVTIGK